MHRYSCKIILRKERPRLDGKCSLNLQAFINGKRKVIPLNIVVHPDEYNQENSKILIIGKLTKQQKQDIYDQNMIIQNCKSKAGNIFTRARLSDVALSITQFAKLYNGTINYSDFNSFMRKEIELLKSDMDVKTIKSYNNTLSKLTKFRPEIPFMELNFSLVTEFNHWLKTSDGQGANSLWKHHRNIKKFVNVALKKGIEFDNPYKQFKAKTVHSERIFLTREEVDILMKVYQDNELPVNIHRSLRMFLFACWTGLRISDVMRVTNEMIIGDELVFLPHKGRGQRKILRIPLSEVAKQYILNNSGKFFDEISEKQVNADLKELAIMTKVKKRISFHTGRHTFAMMFLEVPENKVEVLKEIMGHADIATTMVYVHIHGEHKKESMKRMDIYAKKSAGKPKTTKHSVD